MVSSGLMVIYSPGKLTWNASIEQVALTNISWSDSVAVTSGSLSWHSHTLQKCRTFTGRNPSPQPGNQLLCVEELAAVPAGLEISRSETTAHRLLPEL